MNGLSQRNYKKHWDWLGKLAIVQGLFSTPVTVGLAWIGAILSQGVPYISALGYFGLFCVGIVFFLVLTLIRLLQSLVTQPKKREVPPSKLSSIFQWWGWKWIIFIALVLAGIPFVDFVPRLPQGVSPSDVPFPIASYREMSKDVITGKTVFISDVPRAYSTIIKNKTFDHCFIAGPAVMGLTALGTNNFLFCDFDSYQSSADIFMVLKSRVSVGAIGIDNCTFRNCEFRYISFAGTSQIIDEFMSATNSNTYVPYAP